MKIPSFMELIAPDESYGRIEEVSSSGLHARGIRGLVVDLDNTLVDWNEYHIKDSVREWAEGMLRDGIRICIASNSSSRKRVAMIADRLGIPMLCRAAKPRREAFRQAMRLIGTTPDQTAVIGDQLFTDVLGARRAGLYSILVAPSSGRDFLGTRLVRLVERPLLARLMREACRGGED